MPKERVFTKEEEQEIIDFYLIPSPIKKTCKHFHIGETTLRKVLKRNNVIMRKPGEHCRVYEYNKDFFFTQSANLAYFLGLVAADGCVHRKKNSVYIELQEEDYEILEDIARSMELTRPVKHYITGRGYKNCKLFIEDKDVKNQIVNNFHIPPNKTYDHKNFYFPKVELEEKYWKDYIRGYFDGDGSIKKTGHSLTFQLDGTNYNLIKEIRDIINKHTNIQCQIGSNKGVNLTIYRIYAYGENAKKIFEYLYDTESNLFLKRKKDKYLSMI